MKNFVKLFVLIFVLALGLTLCACGGDSSGDSGHVHDFGSGVVTTEPTFNSTGIKTFTCSCGDSHTETLAALIPTVEQFIAGKNTAMNAEAQHYDFAIKLEGTVSISGFSGTADATYDGKYRYNSTTGALNFYRVTDGKLLLNRQEYIYNQGSSRVVINTDKNNVIKKVSASTQSDDDINMLNLPFESIIKALAADNVTNVKRSNNGKGYDFEVKMHFASDFAPVKKLLSVVGCLGSYISFKNVVFNNPQNGITVYFNVSDSGVLLDYAFDLNIGYNGENPFVITISYAQHDSNTAITMPAVSLISDKSEIQTALNSINTAINNVKNANTYSLNLTARNEFDPGWNKPAIVDSYISTMYKNVNDGRTDFNHSFKYKAHNDADDSSSYTYTVGNIQDGSVYEISRKGSNKQTLLDNVTVVDRFDIHMGLVAFSANDIDFLIKKTNSDGSVTYEIYAKDTATTSMQQKIADLINSNAAEDAQDVENYFNSADYSITAADFSFKVKNNTLVEYSVDIEMNYVPTDGAYSDRNITLNNSISLKVNDELSKASEYVAPKNVASTLTTKGLNNVKYYIQ